MTTRYLFTGQSRAAQVLGVLAAICTVFPAIAVAFLVALKTFWWCAEGGCSLASWPEKARLLTNVVGVSMLVAFFSLLFQFPFLLLARPFCNRSTVEEVFLKYSLPFLGWHDALVRRWVTMLWSRHQ